MKFEIEDTYAEAFEGLFTRIIVTAKDEKRLKKAAYNSTALPSVVINRTEGGIEKWLSEGKLKGISNKNAKILMNFLKDMALGLNVNNKKGARSPARLNSLKSRLVFLISTLEKRKV